MVVVATVYPVVAMVYILDPNRNSFVKNNLSFRMR